ncbi:MAG: hypothetical protein JO297_04375 [Nitrososphaeraceae archaeon]|nr:hypothetical protein [Nitrososphaeraceae archaeon]
MDNDNDVVNKMKLYFANTSISKICLKGKKVLKIITESEVIMNNNGFELEVK